MVLPILHIIHVLFSIVKGKIWRKENYILTILLEWPVHVPLFYCFVCAVFYEFNETLTNALTKLCPHRKMLTSCSFRLNFMLQQANTVEKDQIPQNELIEMVSRRQTFTQIVILKMDYIASVLCTLEILILRVVSFFNWMFFMGGGSMKRHIHYHETVIFNTQN